MKEDIKMLNGDLEFTSDVLVIGIAGGSGSGKNLYINRIIEKIGENYISVVEFDSFYRDLSHLPLHERKTKNFDHPDSLDENEGERVIQSLKKGIDSYIPVYDFKTHTVTGSKPIKAKKIIIVNGILIFHLEKIRKLLDIRIYVETDASIRLRRRADRDVKERGREYPDVLGQWEKTVFPMHILYVKPSKGYAHLIVPNTLKGENNVATTIFVKFLQSFIQQSELVPA